MKSGPFRVAIAQAAPVPLAVTDGIVDLLARAKAAAEAGAALVAFGETFLGGYPLWLDTAPGAALWDHAGTKAVHRILLEQALVPGDARLAPVQALADRTGLVIGFGAHQRVRSSLYNGQYLLRPGAPPLVHRKLVPTHGERLIWGRGDGSTLDVHQADWGLVGSLICWEHWMPLARAAMHALGETVHIAAWPTVNDVHLLASRSYAFEGRCFVLAAGTIQHRRDLLDGLERAGGDPAAQALFAAMPDAVLQQGSSAIIGPDGTIVAQAGESEELLLADIDPGTIGEALTALDSDGHYSRPDVFQLMVDRRPQSGISFRDDQNRESASAAVAPPRSAG